MKKSVCILYILVIILSGCSIMSNQPPTSASTDANFTPELADFSDIIPGKSTIGDLFEKLPHKTGKRFLSELYQIEYEDKNGDIFYIEYDDNGVIQSILYTTTNLPSDDPPNIAPDTTLPEPEYVKEALTLKDFEHIVLGESDFFDLYRIYPEKNAGAISSAHALFEYPAEDGNAIYVKIWDNLKVISIEYTVARR